MRDTNSRRPPKPGPGGDQREEDRRGPAPTSGEEREPTTPPAANSDVAASHPSAPPAEYYRAVNDPPTADRRDENEGALVVRAGTPIPESLARLMSNSLRLARETQEF